MIWGRKGQDMRWEATRRGMSGRRRRDLRWTTVRSGVSWWMATSWRWREQRTKRMANWKSRE
uniref:Uncharacterized protein n=1 Tax=Arundo donax TaxID=35708 RepID=A0A0A9E606_ARUDO